MTVDAEDRRIDYVRSLYIVVAGGPWLDVPTWYELLDKILIAQGQHTRTVCVFSLARLKDSAMAGHTALMWTMGLLVNPPVNFNSFVFMWCIPCLS